MSARRLLAAAGRLSGLFIVGCLLVGGPGPGTLLPSESATSENYQGGGGLDPATDPHYVIYTVRPGDTLSGIATRFHVSLGSLISFNGLRNADAIVIGQRLMIPVSSAAGQPGAVIAARDGPDEKLIPDSEAVYSPAYADFNVNAIAQKYQGHLASYKEKVEGVVLTGPQIVQLLAERFSVGPRLLLTVLEMRSGWVTGQPANSTQLNYPMNMEERVHTGLYYQMWHAANFMNVGYYGRQLSRVDMVTLQDGTRVRFGAGVNPGTAAVQSVLAHGTRYSEWVNQLGADGFKATYQMLFGDPFANAIEPLVPADLQQPLLRLPFENGHGWYFTGGPHGAWADGSAWAAVDFAPGGFNGCTPAREWELAAAPGRIVQVEQGRVMLNVSGETFQGAGWTVMYMHVYNGGRVAKGSYVVTGDRIGHPSCEGGYAQATHLHIARMYNGQWMSVGSNAPFDLGGYTFRPSGNEYDGTMTRNGVVHPAINGHVDRLNLILGEMGSEPVTYRTPTEVP
jgi:murein DD-endopeptidase MepM/ murein hydrolase activator NlpD